MIQCYDDFIGKLLETGFTIGGENSEGVFTLSDSFTDRIRWHTEELDTDPWEWRMRVLQERDDIAYGKVFFRKSGYITREWYPYFLAVRRGGATLEEAYESGSVSREARTVYQMVADNGYVPTHALRGLCGFEPKDKAKLDRALTELQMKLYLTMCGRQQKVSQKGTQFGWNSTVFCTAEAFWGDEVFDQARKIGGAEAAARISERIYQVNPAAAEKKVKKFIFG
jgi:hypothetical protein